MLKKIKKSVLTESKQCAILTKRSRKAQKFLRKTKASKKIKKVVDNSKWM